jgi:hypothetical protein
MNESRQDRFNAQDGDKFDKIDNELEILVNAHNDHDNGNKGWNNINLYDGANKRMGQAVLVGGTVVVSNTSVTANTRIFLSHANTGGTLGHLYISARTAATSFTITSSSNLDTSTVNWLLIEPK